MNRNCATVILFLLLIVEMGSTKKEKQPNSGDPVVVSISRNRTLAEELVPQGKLEEITRARKLAAATSVVPDALTDWYDSQYVGTIVVGTPGIVSLR